MADCSNCKYALLDYEKYYNTNATQLMDKLISALREAHEYAMEWGENPFRYAALYEKAADAIEALSKRLNSVTAERDAAMKRLCEWCGVGCSMENRRAELCEIASVGLEFLAEEGE